MRDAARFYQRIRIAALRRYYRQHLPKRVESGLHAFTVPFGYIRVGGRKPGIIDRPKCDLLVSLKDMFLAGASYRELARAANASGIPPSRGGEWDYSTIRKMLVNPYYAGFVVWGRMRTRFDIRTRKKTQTWKPRDEWKVEEGLHEPLWSAEDYEHIWQEFQCRRNKNAHFRARYAFSGLLVCGVCGKVLRRIANAGKHSVHWRCFPPPDHVRASERAITRVIAKALVEKVSAMHVTPMTEEEVRQQTTTLEASVKKLKDRRERIRDAYETGTGMYTKEEASRKIKDLDAEIDDLEAKIAAVYERAHASVVQAQTLEELESNAVNIPEWLVNAEPREVHGALSRAFKSIIITPDLNKTSRDDSRLKVEFL
jgi:hypothetical protein